MPTNQLQGLIHNLYKVFLRHGAGLTDAQLLDRFIDQREEAALAALMARHGPMVWGVCRRVLRRFHDAEDAFQATFLVLVRKSRSIVPRDLVGNWLHGVALQTARNARAKAVSRRARERQVENMPDVETASHEQSLDWQWLLDQEVSRLPEKYRAAVVLCDLEGKTIKEAAGQFGIPNDTMAGWLRRGRALLVKRLRGQGVVLSIGGLVTLLAQQVTFAQLPTTLARSTLKAASCLAAGQAMRDVVSPEVTTLIQGVLSTMLFRKLKPTALSLLVLLACSWALLTAVQADAQLNHGPKGKLSQACYAAVAVQGKEDAQKLFKAMEQKLLKAKAYKVRIGYIYGNGYGRGEVTLIATADNKLNSVLIHTYYYKDKEQGTIKVIAVSDGKTLTSTVDWGDGEIESQSYEVERKFHEALTNAVARSHTWAVQDVAQSVSFGRTLGEQSGLPSGLTVIGYIPHSVAVNRPRPEPSGFKAVGKDKVGGRDTYVIEYELNLGKRIDKVKLWLDAQTLLPLRRNIEIPGDDEPRFEETTYSNWELDPKLPADVFKLPK